MNSLSLALSIEWDDCTVALAGEDLSGAAIPEIALGARERLGVQGGAQASRDALTLVRQALAQAGQPLSAVQRFLVNTGPGAFTSLRIAVGLVQGLALPRQRPVGAIGALPALAATVPEWRFPQDEASTPWLLCAALDARMHECYYAAFLCRPGHWPEEVLAPAVGTAEQAAGAFAALADALEAAGKIQAVHLAGSGFGPDFAALREWAMKTGQDAGLAAARRPSAQAVLAVAGARGAPALQPASTLRPLYVRDQVALDREGQRQLAAAREAARQAGVRQAAPISPPVRDPEAHPAAIPPRHAAASQTAQAGDHGGACHQPGEHAG